MQFSYDGTERRVYKKDVIGSETREQLYLHDGMNAIVEKAKGGSTTEYVYGPTGIVAMKMSGATYFVLKDHLGSTRVMMDGTNVVASYDYSAFGNVIRVTGSSGIDYYFTGQEYDSTSGLHNYKARMYDSDLMRFYGVDPAGQGASPFAYTGNNPLKYVDPDGEWFFLIPMVVGGVVNVAMNADKIDNWKDFGVQFGIGAASGLLAYASAGGSAAFGFSMNSAVQAGLTKFATNTAAAVAWNIAYDKTGLSKEVRGLGGFGKALDFGLNMVGPAILEAKMYQNQGWGKGVEVDEDISPSEAKRLANEKNYETQVDVGAGRNFDQIDNAIDARAVSYNGKTIYVKEAAAFSPLEVSGGGVIGNHTAVAVKPEDLPIDFKPVKYGAGYGTAAPICHQGATRVMNAAFGTRFLPTQVLSQRFNVAFWQSFYGGGYMPGSAFTYLGSNWARARVR